jgi:predicted transcriptional regulator
MNTLTSTQERALSLLGQGVSPEHTSLALGVTPSAISQLLSDPQFAEQVATLRFTNLAKHSERDNKADSLEDKLLDKIQDLLPFISRPLEAARLYQIVNSAKRRGQSTPDSITNQQEVVQLVMPVQIINQYTVNSNNQVIKAGQQDLVTVQSGRMQHLLTQRKAATNVPSLNGPSESAG